MYFIKTKNNGEEKVPFKLSGMLTQRGEIILVYIQAIDYYNSNVF